MGPGTKSVEDAAQEASSTPAPSELRRSWIKVGLLGLFIAGLLAIVYLSPLKQYVGDVQRLSRQIRDVGPLAPVVLMLGVAVFVAVGFPRLLFCLLAGMALGFWSGLLWAQLGTFLGNYALFVAL